MCKNKAQYFHTIYIFQFYFDTYYKNLAREKNTLGNFYQKSGTEVLPFLFSLVDEEGNKTESVSEEIQYIK